MNRILPKNGLSLKIVNTKILQNEGDPFDYKAQADTFYMNVESVGSIPVDQVVVRGIDTLQKKVASILLALTQMDQDKVNFASGDNNTASNMLGSNEDVMMTGAEQDPYSNASQMGNTDQEGMIMLGSSQVGVIEEKNK
ncbi:AVN_HP_G0119760.mRNA.1.CDS.1 [Saccharomyces cerevisiae]|nr:AVN_HP_G0119760.mRNA.1.CDS.1 [Saccharomyces cerevisiae]CAI6996881.1 AVN_HP_G0119760.mRNA.1.CDS.1 [Saccharomyces cerevisiae]